MTQPPICANFRVHTLTEVVKKLAVVVMICSALVLLRSIALAAAFGDKTLKGHYLLHVSGFDLNDVTAGVGH